MRLSTIAGIGVLVIATAAVAQVARTGPDRKDTPPANLSSDNRSAGNDVTANGSSTDPDANTTPPGTKTEPATPPR